MRLHILHNIQNALCKPRPVMVSRSRRDMLAMAFSADAAIPSAQVVAGWDVDAVKSYFKLDEDDAFVLKKQKVDGKTLLRLDEGKMEKWGLTAGSITSLLSLLTDVRNSGPKTVLLNLAGEEGNDVVEETFESAHVYKDFIMSHHASGLISDDGKFIDAYSYSKVKPGNKYTLKFAGGGLKRSLDDVKSHVDTSAKVTVENCKAALVAQSEKVFGTVLTPVNNNDIPIKDSIRELGDVDCLFTGTLKDGKKLHVLMERKRRIPSEKDAIDVIEQMLTTLAGYKDHGAGGHKPASDDRIESVVFAEAMGPKAAIRFLQSDIFVLRVSGMEVLVPTTRRDADG